ncbi:MAG: NADH dehydrogenase FAD-containing subunit [Erysipelotrichia bacterium]|nr:NADH dehydrogenase FAD-containing subunit [Erysipelotrichia bacterium]
MNTAWILIIFPVITGISSLFIDSERLRKNLLVCVAFLHLFLSIRLCSGAAGELDGVWIGMDHLTRIFLTVVSLLFTGSAIYSMIYLDKHPQADGSDLANWQFLSNRNAIFAACMQFFLAAMSLSVLSMHFGLQWIGVEATTLASTPLIYYHRNRRSLEAAWKYLIICSVGIALALMGVFFLAMTTTSHVQQFTPAGLVLFAGYLKLGWLKVAFIFFLVGYGTKMGLAPMHTWLPDAHSEAPSPVSAMLSGALLNCAFLGILRIYQVCVAIPATAQFASELLVIAGLVSMGLSGIFILRQPDYKRMLAYSSVEHVGILATGIGLGGSAVAGAMLHAICHSLVKSSLFLLSGNILSAYATKKVEKIKGLLKTMPFTGWLWLAGFLAITGTPPFGTFVSEFAILRSALMTRSWVTAVLYLFFLLLVFIGMLTIFMQMTLGKRPDKNDLPEGEEGCHAHSEATTHDKKGKTAHGSSLVEFSEDLLQLITPIVFLSLALCLGCYLPGFVRAAINGAAMLLGGKVL